jgi:hypothetical protein
MLGVNHTAYLIEIAAAISYIIVQHTACIVRKYYKLYLCEYRCTIRSAVL